MNRRSALRSLSSIGAAAILPTFLDVREAASETSVNTLPGQHLRKIATEEAFTIPEIASAIREIVQRSGTNLDLVLLKQLYEQQHTIPAQPKSSSNNVSNRDHAAKDMLPKLLDFEEMRLQDMASNGVDMHVLSLVMPGVQMFAPKQAIELAALANDRLSEVISRQPTRFAGLASFAPQDPNAAAKEMERAIKHLKLNGFIVNSHTGNRYLDDPWFFPVLEASEALQLLSRLDFMGGTGGSCRT
ncbi:hypothetical protein IWX76_001569 [Pedobacter sp. CAN_A7]|uniref:amidohydrolase family protein n=1 Tax=Pedobacter sp. CAN_A7 TaxID=2787722 RepID=UPI0018C9A148